MRQSVRLSFCPFGAVSLPPVRHRRHPRAIRNAGGSYFSVPMDSEESPSILQDGCRYPSSRKSFVFGFPFAVLSVFRLSAKGACRPFVSPSLSRWGKAPRKNTPRNNISKHIFPMPIFFKGNTLNPIQKTPIFARSLSHNEQSLTQRKPPIPFGGFLFFIKVLLSYRLSIIFCLVSSLTLR